jgi:hypothetical protein
MIGALINFITSSPADNFQPMNANFGILPALEEKIKDKKTSIKNTSTGPKWKCAKFQNCFWNMLSKNSKYASISLVKLIGGTLHAC